MKKNRPYPSIEPVSASTPKSHPLRKKSSYEQDEPIQATSVFRGRPPKTRFLEDTTFNRIGQSQSNTAVSKTESRSFKIPRRRKMRNSKKVLAGRNAEEPITVKSLRRSSRFTSPCGVVIQTVDLPEIPPEVVVDPIHIKRKKRLPPIDVDVETSYEAEILEARRRQKGRRKGHYASRYDTDVADFDLHGQEFEPMSHTQTMSENNGSDQFSQPETALDNLDDNVTVTFAHVDQGEEKTYNDNSVIEEQNGSELSFGDELYTEDVVRGPVRGRGRGRGVIKDCDQEFDNDYMAKQSRPGRRKGRQPRKVVSVEYSDESENEDKDVEGCTSFGIMGASRGRGRGRGRGRAKVEVSTVCLRCHEDQGSLSCLKTHLIHAHQAWWTPECPGGATDGPALTRILRQTGKLFCPNCRKEHHGVQYYRFHLDWCGREDERELCNICNKLQKRMFMSQHLYAHEKAQRDIEKVNAQLALMNEKNKEDEGMELNKMGIRKRGAAKRALETINNLDAVDPNPKRHKRRKFELDADYDINAIEAEEPITKSGKGGKMSAAKALRKSAGHGSYTVFDNPDVFSVVCGVLQAQEKPDCVFPNLRPATQDWLPLDAEDRQKYLPEALVSPDFSVTLKNVKSDTKRLMWAESYTTKDQSTIFVGGPIWGIEWCPIPCEESTRQFAAVVCDRSMESEHKPHESNPEPGLIQIWSFGILNSQDKFIPQPVLALSIAHDFGPIRSMNWCPSGAWENPVEFLNEDNVSDEFLPRLGLLAVGCSTGEVFIYSIPHPEIMSQPDPIDVPTLMCKPPPSLVLQIRQVSDLGSCMSVAWQAGKECRYVMAGYAKGYIQIWDLLTSSPLLVTSGPELQILPFRTFKAHQRMVMHCKWNPFVPSTFYTSSYDKQLKFWNLNNPTKPYFQIEIGPVTSCHWVGPLSCGLVVAKDDGYSLEHTGVHFLECGYRGVTGMFKGPLTVHNSCAWDVAFSPLFNFIMSCDASGCIVGHKAVNLSEDIDMKNVAKRRFTIYNIELKKKCPEDDQSEDSFPATYSEMVASTDIEFCDREMDGQLKADRIAATYLSMPTEKYSRYPMQALHKISLNPNLMSCMWLASGGQAGFLRLHQVTGMMSFSGKMFFKNKEKNYVC